MSVIRKSQNFIWSVQEAVGQGATGTVYRCRDKVRMSFKKIENHRDEDVLNTISGWKKVIGSILLYYYLVNIIPGV